MKRIIMMLCVVGTVSSFANDGQRPSKGERGIPPAEAISACEGQETGATCDVTIPRGDTLTGTCRNTPDDKYFVCMPANGAPKGRH